MIKAAIKDGDFDVARAYFEKNPGIPQLNTFVSACTEAPNGLFPAIKLFEDFPDLPDISCYNALLNCANQHDANVAVDILESLPLPPDKLTYDQAMKTCYRLGQYERASHYLKVMREAGFEPDSWTYVQVLKLIDTPEKMETYLMESIPNPTVHCYNEVLKAWAHTKQMSEVIRLLDYMKQQGVAYDHATYYVAICDLGKSGKTEFVNQADELLQQMQEESTPQVAHYDAVMSGWADVDDAHRATKVLIRRIEASSENKSLQPVAGNYHQVASSWMRAGDSKQAALLLLRFYDFAKQGILSTGPDERTRRMIASSLVREKPPQFQKLVDELNKHQKPDN